MNTHWDPEVDEHSTQADYYRQFDEPSPRLIQQNFLKNAFVCLSNPDARFSRSARFVLFFYKLLFLKKTK